MVEIERNTEQIIPRYDLDDRDLQALNTELVGLVEERLGDEGDVAAVWISPDNSLANAVRTIEKRAFPEIEDVMRDYESQSMFLALVDTRDELDRIAHIFRVSGASVVGDTVVASAQVEPERTDIVLVDDIIHSNQGLTAQGFFEYYTQKGYDLSKCISVETNLKVESSQKYNGLPLSQVGYLALFKLMEARGIREGEAAVFAHLNDDAVNSLQFAGLEFGPIAGMDYLKTPTVKEDGTTDFDDHYTPVEIPTNRNNLEIFTTLSALAAPQIYI